MEKWFPTERKVAGVIEEGTEKRIGQATEDRGKYLCGRIGDGSPKQESGRCGTDRDDEIEQADVDRQEEQDLITEFTKNFDIPKSAQAQYCCCSNCRSSPLWREWRNYIKQQETPYDQHIQGNGESDKSRMDVYGEAEACRIAKRL